MCDGGGGGGDSGGGGFGAGEASGDHFGGNASDQIVGGYFPIPLTWLAGVAERIERRPYTTDELFVSISNTIKQHVATSEAHNGLYWRLIHLFIKKPNPNIIELDGMRLRQLLEFFDAYTPGKIDVGKNYHMKLADLKRIVDKAREAITASGRR